MGRKKVHPSKRQRALQACQPCHAAKKRCDCRLPCSNCVKRKTPASCVYSPELPRVPGVARQEKAEISEENSVNTTPAETTTSQSHMLWSSRGNQVYIGDAASLSFLRLLRDILARYMGPSAFTDDAGKSHMLETARNTIGTRGTECNHPFEDSCDLADHFLAATSGVIDILPRESIHESLQSKIHSRTENLENAVMDAILAIGAQTRFGGPQDLRCESIHLARAQQVAFENMLEDPSIDLIRVFLLLSFYMISACRRNSAYIYIGVAARTACALGLHHEESYRVIEEQQRDSRRRTWTSIQVMDLVIGSVLGRPVGTSVIAKSTESNLTSSSTAQNHRGTSLNACLEIWRLAHDAVHKFYDQRSADITMAKAFLSKLEDWSANLPVALRNYTATGSRLRDQELVIGNAHVACSYYFTVMLVTRKFLIIDLMKKLGAGAGRDDTARREDSKSAELAKLTRACTESANLLLQTTRDMLDAGLLLKNMPLFKAWVFAAGLILGFALFAAESTEQRFDRAFGSATDVLHVLSQQSPIAQLYYEILSNFRQAIQQHHERNRMPSKREQDSYVEKIFSLSNHRSEQGSGQLLSPEWGPETTEQTMQSFAEPSPFEPAVLTPDSFDPSFGPVLGDFDSVAAQLWDDLIFNQDFTSDLLS